MRWIVFLMCLLFCIPVSAQKPEGLRITYYSTKEGLPEEQINNISQDSRGFIWIGSREGLFRYDGLHFRAWYANPGTSNTFHYNNIRIIGEYMPAELMFFSGNELWTINTETYAIKPLSSFQNKPVYSVPQKVNGKKWCITDADSVYITNENFIIERSFPVNPYFPAGTIVALTSLHNWYVLLSSLQSTHLYILDTEKGSFTPLKIDDASFDSRVKFIYPQVYDTINRRLYFSAYFNGMYYLDLQLPEVTQYTPAKIMSQPYGQILTSLLYKRHWLLQGGDQHFYLTDVKNDITYNLGLETELNIKKIVIKNLLPASDGSIWMATNSGIARLSMKNQLINYVDLPNAGNAEITTILKAADSSKYFLDVTSGLHRFNVREKKFELISGETDFGWSAIADGESVIFTGGGKNVQAYNTRTKKIKEYKEFEQFFTRTTDLVTLVYRSRNGDLWYSCNGGAGILRQKAGTTAFVQYSRNSQPPSFTHGYVHTAAEDSRGNIWWCNSKSSSLLKWDIQQQRFEEMLIENFLPGKITKSGINNLFIDSRDNLWIVTDAASLIRYHTQNGKTEIFSIHNGLPSESVFGITEDGKGRLWFSTRKGLSCFLPENNRIINYTKNDGLPEDNFTNKGIYYDKTENQIWVAGKKTLAYFNPDSLIHRMSQVIPPVIRDGFTVNGSSMILDDNGPIQLKPLENNIEIAFTSVDFYRNSELEFQYKINKGDWINVGENRKISFNNLPSGDYKVIFRSKYKGSDKWGGISDPVQFHIQTPWYKTNWFWISMVILSGIAIWLIIRAFYLYKLQKQKAVAEKKQAVEKERTRIATDMHDDFGASLSRIKFISEKIKLLTPDDEGLCRDLTKISEYSDEMAEKMNEIVWALNQRYDSCADLVSFCRSYASEYLQDKQLTLNFHCNKIPDKKLPAEMRRNLFLTMKEALRNIVKHAKATEAGISFHFENGIEIIIKDNGIGFDPGHIRPFANGLENMKKRMEDIGGSFDLVFEEGTSIILKADI